MTGEGRDWKQLLEGEDKSIYSYTLFAENASKWETRIIKKKEGKKGRGERMCKA